jgi:hypothetical protein
MPFTIRSTDLNEIYQDLTKEEAIAIANLGAICWSSVKDTQTITTEEGGDAADVWREEGRRVGKQEMLESVRTKLGAAESLQIRLAAAEESMRQLHGGLEVEVARRLAERLDGFRKDYELTKMKELTELKERLAAADAREEMITLMKEKLATLEAQRNTLQTQMLEHTTASTRSSHIIGKIGEATVMDLLENTVLTEFPYSSVKDMTNVSHAADFHLWIMTPKGKKVKMLVDSKKYKRRINSDEINKLIADVDADDDAECGIMISLDSPICTMKQFQIKTTSKHKPIIYLSFDGISEEHSKEVICWAIYSLLAVVKEIGYSSRNYIVDNIDQFLGQINENIKEIDSVIRMQTKALDMLRQTKQGIVSSVTNFRKAAMMDGGDDSSESEQEGGCTTIIKATGQKCGKPVAYGGEKCRHHVSRKKTEVIAHVE